MAIFLDCSRGATFFYVRGRADLVAGRSLRFVRRRGHIDHTLSRCQREHSTRGRQGRRRTRQATQPWFVEASQSISDFSLDATMRQLRSWATEHTINLTSGCPRTALRTWASLWCAGMDRDGPYRYAPWHEWPCPAGATGAEARSARRRSLRVPGTPGQSREGALARQSGHVALRQLLGFILHLLRLDTRTSIPVIGRSPPRGR